MSTALVLLRRRTPHLRPRSLAVNAGAIARHVRARLRAAAKSPAVWALLICGGFSSLPMWWSMGRWALSADMSVLVRGLAIPSLLAMYVWTPLIVAAVAGTAFVARPTGLAAGRLAPALPIGPRSRAVAETLVVLLFMLVARPIGQIVGLELAGGHGRGPLAETLFGLALVLPLVLAWTAVPRLEGRSLLGPALVMCVLPMVILGGTGSSPRMTLLVSMALSALVLMAVGLEIQVEDRRAGVARRSLSFRASPGAVARLRRDRWTGPLERQGVLVGTLLLLLVIVEVRSKILESPWRALELSLALPGLLALTMVIFHPFGLSVASNSGPGLGGFWNGYFGRAWSVLPVPPRSVTRSVYAHGWLVGTALWLLFCGWVWSTVGFDGRLGVVLVAFEAAGVPLAAGVLLCASVGDARRGTLALGALVAFQVVVPMSFPLARDLGVDFLRAPEHRAVASLAAAWLLVLLGGLPPLVHLRGSRRERVASRCAPQSS